MPASAAIHIGANLLTLSLRKPAMEGMRAAPRVSPIAVGIATAVPEILGGTDSAGSVDKYIGYIPPPNKPKKKKIAPNAKADVPTGDEASAIPNAEHSRADMMRAFLRPMISDTDPIENSPINPPKPEADMIRPI